MEKGKEHVKKILNMCRDDDGEFDFVQITLHKSDLQAIENVLNRLELLEKEIGIVKEQHWEDYNIILNQRHMLENNLCTECKRNIEALEV